MFHFNVDFAVECIKSVSDNTQCVACDKLVGPSVRFQCGHSVCKDCAQKTGECLFCLSSLTQYQIDKPQTVRLNNASALLTAFQDTFKIDVYKRQRISDHLKAEKLVFPKCIQAAQKYSNKRKSSNISFNNKENIRPKAFPGEEIKGSDTVIMKKSVQYVQNWLNQHESMPQNLPRRPFGNINVNTQSVVQKSKQDLIKLKNPINTRQSTYRKRSHLKTIYKTSSLLNNVVNSSLEIKNPQKQLEIKKEEKNYGNNHISQKCEKNESGIVLDDEPIVIDDVNTDIIDKDKQAWLAVLAAAERDEYENKDKSKLENKIEINTSLPDIDRIAGATYVGSGNKSEKSKFPKNVLFYKKSSIYETCQLCNNFKTKINCKSKVDKTNNDVSIVINSSTFTTTIKFIQCEESKQAKINKKSVAVQTDQGIPLLKHEKINFVGNVTPQKRKYMVINNGMPTKISKKNDVSQSLDIFVSNNDTKQNFYDSLLKQHKCLIIDNSDSDSNVSCDNTHEVIVEVHKPNAPESVECGILRTLSKTEYELKTKRQIRGHTPNSSNSSDKENVDPNRKKALKLEKKHKRKKH